MADQQNQIQYYATGDSIDYTPSSAVTAGTPLEIGGQAAVPANDIAANVKGAVQVKGNFKVVQKAEIISAGAGVWWDADGDPVGGTAGSGAATATKQTGAADFFLGRCIETSAAADAQVAIELNGKAEAATVAAAAGTDATIIDAIADALRNAGIMAAN